MVTFCFAFVSNYQGRNNIYYKLKLSKKVGKEVMCTMNEALREIAATEFKGIPKGILPTNGQNNNIIIIIVAIIIICCCSGGNEICLPGGRGRRRRRGRSSNGLLFLILAALLLGRNNGGRNINTNLINVETDGPEDDDIIDL